MVEGGLAGLVSRFVPLKANGTEAHGKCPFHDDAGKSLRVGDTWRCVVCGAQDEHSDDAIGFLMSWENCSREIAEQRLANGTLPHPMPIEQARLKRPPFFGLRQALARPDSRIWIHDHAEAVFAARILVPERVHLGLIAGRLWGELGLEPNRYCVLLPTNTVTSQAIMVGLAARLTSAGHTVRLIDPSDRPEYWTLVDAAQQNATHDEIMAWAKDRMRAYVPTNDAAQHANEPSTRSETAAAASPSNAPPPLELPAPSPAPSLLVPDGTGQSAASVQQPTDGVASISGNAEIAQPSPVSASPRPILSVVDKSGALRAPEPSIAPDDQLPAFSEFALAKRFADGPGQDWRYTAAWSLWARWIGHRWEPDERKGVTWAAKECCKAAMQEHLADSTPAQRLKLGTLKTVNAVLGLAGSDPRIAAGAKDWDKDPMLLGVPTGVIDLRTGQAVAAAREQMISKSTSCSPQAGPHPWWDRVLERGHKDDPEVYGLIHRWCGYMLTGDTREERFLFIHGPGAGGKSKFLAVLSELLGDYRKTAKMESFTAKDKTEHSEEIARLAGARMVTATETEEGSRWNEARIKTLTGRDAIAARHMHKSTFEFQPQFKLVFIGNHRPALRSVGEEMRRRIDLIEWAGTIPEAERVLDLGDKLRAEYPAILAWMIEGCLAWQREGLGKPPAVEAATREYLSAEDTLGAWIEECITLEANAHCKSSAAYLSFKRWAEQAGEYVPSQKRFSQRLVDRGFVQRRTSAERQFLGFSIKASNFEPDPAAWLPPDR